MVTFLSLLKSSPTRRDFQAETFGTKSLTSLKRVLSDVSKTAVPKSRCREGTNMLGHSNSHRFEERLRNLEEAGFRLDRLNNCEKDLYTQDMPLQISSQLRLPSKP